MKRKSRLQTLIVVMKIIVVRNLFSFEYDGSNPSLPTIKSVTYVTDFILLTVLTKRKSEIKSLYEQKFRRRKQ